jgi:hypothetical protein
VRRGRPFGKSVGSKQAGHGKGHVIDHTKLHGKNKASGIFCAHLSSTWHVQERRVEKCSGTVSEIAFTYIKHLLNITINYFKELATF